MCLRDQGGVEANWAQSGARRRGRDQGGVEANWAQSGRGGEGSRQTGHGDEREGRATARRARRGGANPR